MKINNRTLIITLLIIGLAVGLVHVFLMPPFQNPDEVQHFLYSATYAYDPQQMEAMETRVLEMLKTYKWFHFVGIGPGWENTQTISDISYVFHFDPDRKTARKTFFHFLYGTILKISGIKDVLTAFYFMRIISTFFYIIILFLAAWFFRTYFPQKWEYLFIGMILVFQLMTILNAVNYDVFMVLFGTLFFIFAYQYLQSERKIYLAFLLIAALMGTLTKLVGIMFFVYLFILLCMKVKWNLDLLKRFFLILLAVIIGFCWINYLFPGRFYNLYSVIFNVLGDTGGSLAPAGEKVLRLSLFDSMADSFYFHTGWMGFKLSAFWYLVLKIFLLFSIVGLFSGLFIKKINLPPLEKKWMIYTFIVCALQVFAIWFYYGSKVTVQGRYLYPLIIPFIVLIYSGLHYLERWFQFKKNYILISYIIFQVVMVVFAITRIISVFYLEMASPHPGL
ncbi:MAG: hypothetical protein JSV88_07065 [Candidatus Aminicenantes bacterium]|nr:MAG: hypothetical protein JSV88_07065 [Candidatus Aminicenantes bacterium]